MSSLLSDIALLISSLRLLDWKMWEDYVALCLCKISKYIIYIFVYARESVFVFFTVVTGAGVGHSDDKVFCCFVVLIGGRNRLF